ANFSVASMQIQKLLVLVFKYIKKNYQSGKLNEFCRLTNYNPSYVSKTIHRYTGNTFKQLVNIYRIKQAKVLLRDLNLSIDSIARKVGFSNITIFYKNFEKETKQTPSKFRKKNFTM
ncbi:hypothetical protein Q757_08710, partial [Oenococcus alcoholitolerans]